MYYYLRMWKHESIGYCRKPPKEREFNFDIGMLCRISPVKRVYETILMVNSLREEGFDVRLHIAGTPDGDLRYAAASERLVEKLGLKDAVHFYGHVSDSAAWLGCHLVADHAQIVRVNHHLIAGP